MDTYKDELRHYGVLGMKWGVRKSRPTSSRKNSKSNKSESSSKKGLDDKTKRRLKIAAGVAAGVGTAALIANPRTRKMMQTQASIAKYRATRAKDRAKETAKDMVRAYNANRPPRVVDVKAKAVYKDGTVRYTGYVKGLLGKEKLESIAVGPNAHYFNRGKHKLVGLLQPQQYANYTLEQVYDYGDLGRLTQYRYINRN